MKNHFIIAGLVAVCGLSIVLISVGAEKKQHMTSEGVSSVVKSGSSATSEEATDKFANDPQWFADKAWLAGNLKTRESDETLCQKSWDILWSWSKRGNREARQMLLSATSPDIGFNAINADQIIKSMSFETYMRAFSVHSQDYPDLNFKGKAVPKTTEEIRFYECINNKEENCAKIAVEDHLVMSFKDFAARIDAELARGKKFRCETRGG